ncbi:type I glyceraldehyde-3-phosphate dehydrogenase [Candidatus Peregrinibacteria bacterium CG_4_10_14_0_2_um_filter_38_24]|nr:MAG: type I glyceraldehyde-3-phosphate dehydrogenase [Candidatus Peregrinibacteria bacterium CG_4_10_14_0_2_um_filter_38_24]
MLKVAINGFGRIGRQIFHINSEKKYFEVVAINDLTDSKTLAHLLKYDSNYGIAKQEISATESEIIIDGKAVKIFKEMDPERLPWKDLGIDLVIESTGAFTKKEGAKKHLKAGAKKVIVTAPGTDLDLTIVLGVNENEYDSSKHNLVSNASCTTNCLAPVVKIINDNFGIVKGSMTTIHSYTNDQRILDLPHKDLRRARSAGQSIIPTTTGAAKAIGLVIPELDGRLNGVSIRVPTPTVSIVDLVCETKKDTTVEEVNTALKKAAETSMKNILGYTELPLVSIDFRGNPLSSIVDSLSTQVMEKNLVKVLSWYDNEWGYSNRVVDLVKFMGEKM